MNNKKLFEEAIAEAKSIREAAIANAKEALEETLTPHIKELLAQRLTEMEEEDELPGPPEEKLPVLEAEEDEDEKEEEGAEEAGEEAGEESEEKDMEIEDMSVEELKDLIRDIVGQMVDQDGDGDHDSADHELEEPEMGMEEPAGEEAPGDEEIDIEELLAELAMEDDDQLPPPPAEINVDLDEAPIEEGASELLNSAIDILNSIPNLDTLPTETVLKIIGLGAGGVIGGSTALFSLLEKMRAGDYGSKAVALANRILKNRGAGAAVKSGQSKGQYEQVASELNEAKKTIKQLTTNLQEVNLLNAKLLYVNKVLKENKHLSDAQVANVIATFDKATTAKEAKLVYESFATTLVRKSNAPVVESKLKGLASKSTGVAPAKVEVIAEVSDAVKRMQKLAGIIK
jgi:hypothetical protein